MKGRFGLSFILVVLLACAGWFAPAARAAGGFPLSGRIITTTGKAVSLVTMSMNGSSVISADTGIYAFNDVAPGSYTLVPLKVGCTFTPTSRTVVVSAAAVGEINFQAACVYTLTGTVLDAAGNGLAGATVSALQNAGVVKSVVTDSVGLFSLSGLPDGEYWITAGKSGYRFANGAYAVQIPESMMIPSGFFNGEPQAQGYGVLGAVFDQFGTPLSGVTVTDELGDIAVTDASGTYQFKSLAAGVHKLAASKKGFVFSPEERHVNLPPAADGIIFIGISKPVASASVTGSILDANGKPLADAVVYVGQDPLGFTDPYGNYTLRDLMPGIYTIQAVKDGYTFYPISRTVSLPRDGSGQDFIGR